MGDPIVQLFSLIRAFTRPVAFCIIMLCLWNVLWIRIGSGCKWVGASGSGFETQACKKGPAIILQELAPSLHAGGLSMDLESPHRDIIKILDFISIFR
jgi:hypothetical protein